MITITVCERMGDNMEKVAKFFKFEELKTNASTEIIAGLTTFMTMAYVLVVQPSAICGFGDAEVLLM